LGADVAILLTKQTYLPRLMHDDLDCAGDKNLGVKRNFDEPDKANRFSKGSKREFTTSIDKPLLTGLPLNP
jgi:hypothetical protein